MEKYSLVQKLGQGSFALVWKARRKSDGRLVAVKQLKISPESWEACKMLPEVRAAAAITDRRHIVQLLEAVRHCGELFLVFEYLESSLFACLSQARRLDQGQVRWAGRRLLAALAAVHAAGLVHCDVKPENILVGADSMPGGATMKLCDFGQAATPDSIRTYVGTRWYRAPELLLEEKCDSGIDVWAAGCVLAEMLLRRPLAPGTDNRDMIFRICGELGAPAVASSWSLAARFMKVSGRPHAPPAVWDALREAGAAEAALVLFSGLLHYDSSCRIRADRALKEAFFAEGQPEAPISRPPARPLSPETLRQLREEAVAAEKKILRTPAASPVESAGSNPSSFGVVKTAFGGRIALGVAAPNPAGTGAIDGCGQELSPANITPQTEESPKVRCTPSVRQKACPEDSPPAAMSGGSLPSSEEENEYVPGTVKNAFANKADNALSPGGPRPSRLAQARLRQPAVSSPFLLAEKLSASIGPEQSGEASLTIPVPLGSTELSAEESPASVTAAATRRRRSPRARPSAFQGRPRPPD